MKQRPLVIAGGALVVLVVLAGRVSGKDTWIVPPPAPPPAVPAVVGALAEDLAIETVVLVPQEMPDGLIIDNLRP